MNSATISRAVTPLGFVDSQLHQERLREARERIGECEAAIFGPAAMEGGHSVVLLAMDFRLLGESMGKGVGDAVARGAEIRLRRL